MTDTLISINVAGSADKLVRLSGFTSTPVATIDISTIVGFSVPSSNMFGCNWNSEGDACFIGYAAGQRAYKLLGFSTTWKDERQVGDNSHYAICDRAAETAEGLPSGVSNPIFKKTFGGPGSYTGNAVEFHGWSSTQLRNVALDVSDPDGDGVFDLEWDGDNLYGSVQTGNPPPATHCYLTKYRTFSSTIEFQFDRVTNDNDVLGISLSGSNVLWAGRQHNKIHRQVAFTSTEDGTGIDVSAFGGTVQGISHMSYAERTAGQSTFVGSSEDVYWTGLKDQAGAGSSLYRSWGFTSSLQGVPVRLGANDTAFDLTHDGTNFYWCGKKNTNEPILRKVSGFSSTQVGLDIPTSGLGDTDPRGISWDGVNILWAGAGTTDKLYRQLGFSSTPNGSVACPPGELEPRGVSWVGTHTIWSNNQGHIIRSPGFTTTATEQFTPHAPTKLRAVSYTGADVIWARDGSDSGDNEASLVKQVGFSTTIKAITYVDSIDWGPSGIEHWSLTERIGPGFAVVIRPRVGRRKIRRRSRQPIRIGRRTFPGVAAAAGPRPLQSRVTRRVRKPRNQKVRQAVLTNKPMHTSVAPLPAPPELGDILWLEGDGGSYSTIGVDVGITGVPRSTIDITAITLNPWGLSWDGADAYFTASVLTFGEESDSRIHRTLGWSSTLRDSLFLPLGSEPYGVCWDGRDTLWSDEPTHSHYKQSGLTSTILAVQPLDGLNEQPYGLTWTGGERIWVGSNTATGQIAVYRSAGFSSTIIDSVSGETAGGTNPGTIYDVTWDGGNLIVGGVYDIGLGGIERRSGWSSTFDITIHNGGVVSGICVADVRYRLGGPNPVRRMRVVPRLKRRTFRPVARLSRPQIHVNPPAAPTGFSPATLRRPFRRAIMRSRPRRVVRIGAPLIDIRRHYFTGRGKYRIFNTAAYIFYRSNTGPPTENDVLYESSASLPATPATTFADGTWWISVAYFNGVIKSGFLPLGPNGETFIRLDIAGGVVAASPPQPPGDWRLEVRAGGVIRVVGLYFQADSNRATDWAITYTTNGSTPGTPPAVSPTVTVLMPTRGLAVLAYDLPAQANGTTVKVRLQTKRSTAYSENSVVKTAIADASGPSAPLVGQRWPGRLPESL